MTPISELLNPESNSALYTAAVLNLYVDLPDTPLRTNIQDLRMAQRLFETHVPLPLVEAALLLASLRRLCRPPDLPPLPRVRSLAYFQPVIEELQANPVPDGYVGYLRLKLRSLVDNADPAKVQKPTFSGDR
ncbi:MAG TPA: hypothetical protein VLY24_21700 [Bryobacteraceae bacterium]|nr:hypothetical protein [Bryobacteraceae bacterium]